MRSKDIRYQPREYHTEEGAMEPITGGLGALVGTIGNLMLGMVDIPIDVAKAIAVKSTAGSLEGPGADRSSTSIISPGRSIDSDRHDNSQRGVGTDSSATSYQLIRTPSSSSVTSRQINTPDCMSTVGSFRSAQAQDSVSRQTSRSQGRRSARTSASLDGAREPSNKEAKKNSKGKGKITAGKVCDFSKKRSIVRTH